MSVGATNAFDAQSAEFEVPLSLFRRGMFYILVVFRSFRIPDPLTAQLKEALCSQRLSRCLFGGDVPWGALGPQGMTHFSAGKRNSDTHGSDL